MRKKETLAFEGKFYNGVVSVVFRNGYQVEEFISECGKVFRNDCGWEEVNQDAEADLEAWHNCESSEMNV